MKGLSPDALFFVAQYIRHQKALLTSLETFSKSPTFSVEELRAAIRNCRAVLDGFEVATQPGDKSSATNR